MECYSEQKINELLSYEETEQNLKFLLLRERSQSEKTIYHRIPIILHAGNHETIETVRRFSGLQG